MKNKVYFNDYEELEVAMLNVIDFVEDVCVICDFDDAHMYKESVDFNDYNYISIDIEDSEVDEDMPYYIVARNGDEFTIRPVVNNDGELVKSGFDKVYIMSYVDEEVKEFYEDSESIEFVFEDEECRCECCCCKEDKYVDKSLDIKPDSLVEITINGKKITGKEKEFEAVWKNLIEDMFNFKF